MEQHAKEQKQKVLGQSNIRKRDTQATKADMHIKSNLSKVNQDPEKEVIGSITTKTTTRPNKAARKTNDTSKPTISDLLHNQSKKVHTGDNEAEQSSEENERHLIENSKLN